MNQPTPSPGPDKNRPARWFRATSASSVGIEIAVAVCVPTLLGRWADSSYEQLAPFGVLIGLTVGCLAAVRAVQRSLADYKRELRNPSDPHESLLIPGSMGSLLDRASQAAAKDSQAAEQSPPDAS